MAELGYFDSVAAVLAENRVSEALSMIHRQGHGHHSRLIRADAGCFATRLDQTGVPAGIKNSALSGGELAVLIIGAPHQSIQVAELLLGLGAIQVERFTASHSVSVLLAFDPSLLERRPGRRPAQASKVSPPIPGASDQAHKQGNPGV